VGCSSAEPTSSSDNVLKIENLFEKKIALTIEFGAKLEMCFFNYPKKLSAPPSPDITFDSMHTFPPGEGKGMREN